MDEETTKRLEDKICKRVEEALNIDDIKEEMKSKIEKGHKKLVNDITLHLQKEKEENIIQGCQKIFEEVELELEYVHDKYEGTISKARVIKYQAQNIQDVIISENNINVISVQKEENP